MHDACLVQDLGKHRFECFRHPLEAIGHRDENVFDTLILQLVENAGSKGRSFIFRKPHPQDLSSTVNPHADGQMYGHILDTTIATYYMAKYDGIKPCNS